MQKRNNSFKIERVQSEITKVLECMLSGEIKDPRIDCFVTVSDVILSKDMSNCKVYVEIPSDEKEKVLEGLKHAAGYMRSEIANTLDLRKTPELHFIIDDTKDKRNRIEELLRDIHEKESNS